MTFPEAKRSQVPSKKTTAPTPSLSPPAPAHVAPPMRRQSSSASSVASSTSTSTSRVQLVPHVRSFGSTSFSESERQYLAKATFEQSDLSAQEFDFDDIFTFDRPQTQSPLTVEASSPTRNWSNFSASHYSSAVAMRNKVNRSRSNKGEKYAKTPIEARRR